MYTYTYICIHDTNPNDTQICNFTKRYKYNQKLFKRPTCMKIDLYKNLTSTKKRPTPNKKMAKRLQVQNTYSYTKRTYTEKDLCTTRQWSRKLHVCV